MIVGIGMDLCDRNRVAKAMERFGDTFCQRVLVGSELQELETHSNKSAFVARRIAAKEAVVKVLGTGFAKGVGWQQIAIEHLPSGQPVAQLSGAAQQIVSERGISLHLSITDERDMAAAVAIAEKV